MAPILRRARNGRWDCAGPGALRRTACSSPAARRGAADVDIWVCPLDRPAVQHPDLVLSAAEARRAQRFASPSARRRYVAARTRLRGILSHYVRLGPERLIIQESPTGKPELHHPDCDLTFNLAHAGDMAVLAVSHGARIGVDIEPRARAPRASTVGRWLHDGERLDLRRVPAARRSQAFLRLWCRKEAVLKADGRGLQFPLHRFRVSLPPESPAVLASPGAGGWWLYGREVSSASSCGLA